MLDYKNGKIYIIKNKYDEKLIYVGSTAEKYLSARKAHHRALWKSNKNCMPLYREIENWDEWILELYELFPCSCVEELHKRESDVIKQIGTLNKNMPYRSNEEIKKRQLQYTKDTFEKRRDYRLEHKEKIDAYNKKHYEENIDYHKERKHIYNTTLPEDKRKEINLRRRTKCICECGEEIIKDSKARHITSKRHIDKMSAINK